MECFKSERSAGTLEQIGELLRRANLTEQFAQPANTFVAGFIGSPPMNLVPGVLESQGGGLSVRLSDGLSLPVPAGESDGLEQGRAVVAGLRTEDLRPVDQDDRGLANSEFCLDGEVEVVEPLGSETNLHMVFQGVRMVARSEGRRVHRPGESLRLCVDLNHLHLFDRESEKAIYHGAAAGGGGDAAC